MKSLIETGLEIPLILGFVSYLIKTAFIEVKVNNEFNFFSLESSTSSSSSEEDKYPYRRRAARWILF